MRIGRTLCRHTSLPIDYQDVSCVMSQTRHLEEFEQQVQDEKLHTHGSTTSKFQKIVEVIKETFQESRDH